MIRTDMLKKLLFIVIVVVAWENRHTIASFVERCWKDGVTVSVTS